MVDYANVDMSHVVQCVQCTLKNRRLAEFGDNQVDTAMFYNSRSEIYLRQGKYELALKSSTTSLKILQAKLGDNHEKMATPYYNLARAQHHLGYYEQALENMNRVLAIDSRHMSADDPRLQATKDNIEKIKSDWPAKTNLSKE